MTFGLAIVSPRTRSSVRRGHRHDCGRFGKLTCTEIALVAGISVETVYLRLRQGVAGEALCASAYQRARDKNKAPCAHPFMLIACQLATEFPDRVPTTQEIRAVRPMSRAAAVRWKQALRDAKEMRR